MGTYETIQDIQKELDDVSLPKKKKKNKTKLTVVAISDKMNSYKLLSEIANDVLFFGKVWTSDDKRMTAEFICRCGEAFRSELPPILSGKTKTCGCKTK